MNFLKKHWGSIASVLAWGAAYIDWNTVTTYAHTHAKTAVGVGLSAFLALYNAKAPKDKINP